MPQVLTTNAIIMCPHGGKGTTIPTMPIWSVNGGFVLLEGDTGTLACPFVLMPCVGYTLKSMSLNTTKVNGRNVILVTDFNQTFTGLPLIMVETHQVIDNSTPAPIPAGQTTAPPLPPDMADEVKPIVIAMPPVLAFNTMTMQPATIAATFNLSSPFPSKWALTLINTVAKYNLDISNGLPPGVVVTPPGGFWASPSMTIVMTLTAPFMAALGIGMHHFFMTGVNKRGLSGFGEVVLTVT